MPLTPPNQLVNNRRQRGWEKNVEGDFEYSNPFTQREFLGFYEGLDREFPELVAELVLGINPRAFLR